MFTPEKKAALERSIVENVISSLRNGSLTAEQVSQVADFGLSEIIKISNDQDLTNFLVLLSEKWPNFKNLLEMQKGVIKEREEDEVFNGVLLLSKHGKVDDAIRLAKTVTQK